MLLDLTVVFIPATQYIGSDRFAPITPPQASALQNVLEQHPDVRAVLVTSPDYFGTCPDLIALAGIARDFNCPFLVDEAHGAHLCFSPKMLPPSALAAGASACVQSAHKTLPALTQAAYIHLGTDFAQNQPNLQHVRRGLSLFQTSSPSLMIGASLDFARALMDHSGTRFIQSTLEAIERFASELSPVFYCTTVDRQMLNEVMRDPMRVVIDVSETGYTGFALSEMLARQNIDIEMADLRRLILIPDLIHAHMTLPVVSAALNKIVLNHHPYSQCKAKVTKRNFELIRLDHDFYHYLQTSVKNELRIESPLLSGTLTRQIPLTESAGRYLADALIPYPPGIALIWPGEILEPQMLEMLRDLVDNGFCLQGMMHGSEGESLCVAH
jgi:lysine decarboxylase